VTEQRHGLFNVENKGRTLALQRINAALVLPFWISLAFAVVQFGVRYRFEGVKELRREFARAARDGGGPVLVCPNHLTLADPLLVGWSLGSLSWYARHWWAPPWIVLAQKNVERIFPAMLRPLAWIAKCIPIPRGGNRFAVAAVLERLKNLLMLGDAVLIFPEGRRGRNGQVDVQANTYGVGRVLQAVPGCRVLCIYIRGELQQSWSDIPACGDRFHVRFAWLEPMSDARGMRRSVELTNQVLSRLANLENEHFAEMRLRSGDENVHPNAAEFQPVSPNPCSTTTL